MNPITTEIREFPTKMAAEKAGYSVPLTEQQADFLRPLSRRDRRAWLRKEKKRLAKIARRAGESDTQGAAK